MKKNKVTICQRCGAKIEGNVKVCPYCGAEIKRAPFYTKKWFIILVAVIALGIMLSMCSRLGNRKSEENSNSDPEYNTVVEWPDSEIGSLLPETDAMASSVNYDSEYIYAYMKMTKDEYKDYVKQCQEKGFKTDASSSEGEDYCYYSAKNKSGYELSLNWDGEDNECSLSLSAPEEKEKKKKASKKKESSDNKTQDNSSGDGVTPDFKEAMDEYERFFDRYAEFMESYSNGSGGSLAEYAEFMAQYSETMSKLEDIDEDSLSPADEAYYLEVMARINKRLAEVVS